MGMQDPIPSTSADVLLWIIDYAAHNGQLDLCEAASAALAGAKPLAKDLAPANIIGVKLAWCTVLSDVLDDTIDASTAAVLVHLLHAQSQVGSV